MRALTVSLLLVVVVSIFGLGWGLDSLFARYGGDSKSDVDSFETVSAGIANTLDAMAAPELFVSQWQNEQYASVSLSAIADFPLPSSIEEQFLAGEPLLLESEQGVSANYYLPSHDKVFSMDSVATTSDNQVWLKAVFTSLFYLGTLLLVLLWLKPLLLRLHNLRTAADEFGSGNLDSRVRTEGISYISDIELKYNRMADQIQTLIEDNKLLTSAVSHDLRTPLARLRFGVDTLSDTDNPTVRLTYQKRISADLNEMESLVDSLLRYARLDSVMGDVVKGQVPLQDLIQQCVSQYLDEEIDMSLRIDPAIDSSQFNVYGSYEHLATVVNNLLQNAITYADSKVIVELYIVNVKGNEIRPAFSVSDDGPGMAEEDRFKLLKPFQRGKDYGRTGYGLGLAVVARIVDYHQAQLDIGTSAKMGGAKFEVSFAHS